MALYEYECMPNGHRFEVRHGMNESPVYSCLECKGDTRRVITAPGIVFKGGGFYVTDSRKTSEAGTGSKSRSEGERSQSKAGSETTTARDASVDVKAVT